MSKILLLADNRTDLVSPVLMEMRNRGHEVTYVDASELDSMPKYPNLLCRLRAKCFDGPVKGVKRHWGRERFFEDIAEQSFDKAIVLIPAMLNAVCFRWIKQASSETVGVLWDSLNKEPAGKIALEYCDKVFSFDLEDCSHSQVGYLPTFHLEEASTRESIPEYDVFGVFSIEGGSDPRFQYIQTLIKSNPELSGYIHCVTDKAPAGRQDNGKLTLVCSPERLLGDELEERILHARCLLDIVDPRQSGLSPRISDAVRYRKKLITNNTSVENEAWFTENTLLLDSADSKIESGFVEQAYQEVTSPNTLAGWVSRVLS